MQGGVSHVDSYDYKPRLARARRRGDAVRGRPRDRQHRHARHHPARHEVALEVRAATASAAAGPRRCFPRSTSTSTIFASSTRCTPKASPTARRPSSCTAARRTRFGPRWDPGCSTGWAPRMRTFPASSRSVPRRATAARGTTATPSCRPSIRARRSARPADRRPGAAFRNLTNPAASSDDSRRELDSAAALQRRTGRSAGRATRNSTRSSPPMSWPGGCRATPRRARPRVASRPQTLAHVRHRRARRPTTSAGNVCWPVACAKQACASSR